LSHRAVTKKHEDNTGIESLELEVNRHRIFYLRAGSGPRDWIGTMASLRRHFSLYAPDMIGFGRSDRRESGYYLYDFSNFVLGFADSLGLGNAALVGHSFGGRIALQLARRYPERFGRLVLVDSAGLGEASSFGNFLLTFFKVARRLLGIPQPYPRFLARAGEESEWTYAEALQDIKAPTLIIWKRHDPYLPLALARRAETMIPGASLAVIPGYGHAPHAENSEAFSTLLLDFLSGD
jgi:pimeloyl-ACP methyl ester carboxylesterase